MWLFVEEQEQEEVPLEMHIEHMQQVPVTEQQVIPSIFYPYRSSNQENCEKRTYCPRCVI